MRESEVLNAWMKIINNEISGGHLSIDFGERVMVVMDEVIYGMHICDSSCALNEFKAHAYFKAIRLWVNCSRRAWNGEREAMGSNERIRDLGDDEVVMFGVMDGEDRIYLIGREVGNGGVDVGVVEGG